MSHTNSAQRLKALDLKALSVERLRRGLRQLYLANWQPNRSSYLVQDHLPTQLHVRPGLLQSRLRHSRENPLVAQMILHLCSQIEAELLSQVRRGPGSLNVVKSIGMEEDLRRTQERSASSASSAQTTSDSLLDFATFGQLVRIAENMKAGFAFPIHKSKLWEIAALRNRAAHGQQTGWRALRQLVEAVLLCD